MIPILYEADETAFTSEGIGPLSDVLSCYVEEERNGIYELEMEYPVTGTLFSELKTHRVILAKANDSGEWQPFDIYNVSPSMDGVVTINAEHASYRLSGIPVEPFTATGIASALQGLKQHSLIQNPFTVWTDIDNTTTKYSVNIPQSFRACLAGTDGSILDTFSGSRGCEFEFDRFQVKVHAHRGQNNGVVIEYGKNLTDLEQEEDISECYTGVLAYWKDNQESDRLLWSDIQYIENHASYPRERIYVLDASNDFDQDETVTKDLLNQRAAEYGEDNDIGRPSVNLTISFINLSQTAEFADSAPIESVRLCDEVTVYFPLLGVDATTQVVRTKYDSILERYEEIELGDVKNSFADTIKQSVNDSVVKPAVDETKSIFTEALKYATDKLTGAYGGHVVIGRNADGEPNEIYIMDTDSVETAQTVLRINMNGIGGSTTGINGPYNLAILTDGTINASQITSGTIDGNLIRGGTIVAGALDEVLNNKINSNITDVSVQYAMNQSQTTPPTDGWSENAPEWQEGYYIWQRTETVLADGDKKYSEALCITGIKGDTGIGLTSIIPQYYLSTSNTAQEGGTWQDTEPEYVSGRYYWTRSKIVWTDNLTTYTSAVLAEGVNNANSSAENANETASSAQSTANNAQSAASNAQASADAAQSAANNAQQAADNAQQAADNAQEMAGNAQQTAMEAQAASDKANALASGATAGLQQISQVFYADSTGAHVKAANDNETVIQSDGMHVMVGDTEVARFTRDDSHVDNLAIGRFLMFGAHRAEVYEQDGEVGTGFFWIGDVS